MPNRPTGEQIIEAVIRADAVGADSPGVIKWSANAAEQIEAALPVEIVSDDQLTIEAMARQEKQLRDEYNELSARFKKAKAALEQLAECELHEGNCASFDVANRCIRNLARIGLG